MVYRMNSKLTNKLPASKYKLLTEDGPHLTSHFQPGKWWNTHLDKQSEQYSVLESAL